MPRLAATDPQIALHALRDALVCPDCSGVLSWADEGASCTACGRTHPIREGVPILLPAGGVADEHKLLQAAAHDTADDSEFEIERPHGTPRLYEWLLRFKFASGVSEIAPMLDGCRAVVVCSGSGMDAEFLAERGAVVVACDISYGAVKRARERARRRGLPILALVADAEQLPLADASVELAYVHDGLHHLERPSMAVAEMTRVARTAVSINEPASAVVTRLTVLLGISESREEAGNAVIRFRSDDVRDELERNGFGLLRAVRLAMFYRHFPGTLQRLLSGRATFWAAKAVILGANRVIGRFGNKLSVQAVRR